MVLPIGTPLPMPFADVMMSGFTFQCSMPNHLSPVRPQPVCTSSAMNSPPCFSCDLVDAFEIARRRHDEAADADDRLGHERGDLAGGRRLDHFLDVVRTCSAAIVRRCPERAAVAVRRMRVDDARDLRRQRPPVRMARPTKARSPSGRSNCAAARRSRAGRSRAWRPSSRSRWPRCRCW